MRNGYFQLKFAHFVDLSQPMPASTAAAPVPTPIPVFKLYGEHAPWPTPDMMHCETIAARSTLHNWQIRPHQHHGLFQALYLKAGHARIRADDAELDMQAGQVLLVPQMCIHGFNFAPHAEGHVLTLAYPLLARVGGAASESLLGLRKPYLHCLPSGEEGDDLRMHFATMDREYRQAAAHRELLLEALLAAVLAWLARQIAPPAPATLQPDAPARGSRHFGRYCQMIEAEYSTRHAVSWYADRLGISAAHLNALCRQASRQSALELIHERLLLEARRSLAYSARSVSAVSYALGYTDPAYFTRFFKQRVGLSPTAFRARALATFSASGVGV
jgi:AraC family transcriptional activator of pobA